MAASIITLKIDGYPEQPDATEAAERDAEIGAVLGDLVESLQTNVPDQVSGGLVTITPGGSWTPLVVPAAEPV